MTQHTRWPKISLVTPTLNQGQFIERTIRSVLEQGYPSLEYIVIDGGSTDCTPEVLRRYERHLAYWVSEPDSGQAEAINKGFSRATGDVFNWLNSDDTLCPGALRAIAEGFRSSGAMLVSGRRKVAGTGAQWERVFPPTETCDSVEESLFSGRTCQPATFLRMDAARALWPLTEDLHYCMDVEAWRAYLCRFGHSGISTIDKILAVQALHPGAKTVAHQRSFFFESASLHYTIARQLGLGSEVAGLFGSLSVRPLRRRPWPLEQTLDPARFLNCCAQYYGPYTVDSSRLDRELSLYYLYRGLRIPALRAVMRALVAAPWRHTNYRYLLHVARVALANHP